MANIFVNVKGGLGNQLFQAALGIALQARTGGTVHHVAAHFASDAYGRTFSLPRFPRLPVRVAGDPAAYEGLPVFTERPGGSLDDVAAFVERHGDVVVDGYWQNEAYFAEAGDAVRAAFLPDMPVDLVQRGNWLRSEQAIGVHVRRSDYGHHGLARMDYYRLCIGQIRQRHGDLPLLIVTDEQNFCAFEFRGIGNAILLKGNPDDPLSDFYLLSRCRHFVIANSSFSWWAAWLGEAEGAVVCAPQPWCVFDEALNPPPPRWLSIQNAVLKP